MSVESDTDGSLVQARLALKDRCPGLQVCEVNRQDQIVMLHVWKPAEITSVIYGFEFMPSFHITILPVLTQEKTKVQLQIRLYTYHGKKLTEDLVDLEDLKNPEFKVDVLEDMENGKLQLCEGIQDLRSDALERFLRTIKLPLFDKIKHLFFIEQWHNEAVVRSRLCRFVVSDALPKSDPAVTDYVRCSECDAFSHQRSLTFFTFLKQFRDSEFSEFSNISKSLNFTSDCQDPNDHESFRKVFVEVEDAEKKMSKCLRTFQAMSHLGMFSKSEPGEENDANASLANGASDMDLPGDAQLSDDEDDTLSGLLETIEGDDTKEEDEVKVKYESDLVPSKEFMQEPTKNISDVEIDLKRKPDGCDEYQDEDEDDLDSFNPEDVLQKVKVEVKEEQMEGVDQMIKPEDLLKFMQKEQGIFDQIDQTGEFDEQDKMVAEKRRKKREYSKKKREIDRQRGIKQRWYPKTYRKPCPICLHHYSAPSLIAKCISRHEEELTLDIAVRCPLCYIELESKRNVTQHFADHHADTGRTCCCECLLVIPNENNRLRRHFIKKHHSAGKPEICAQCGKTLPTARELKIHMEDHENNGAICHECGKVFQSRKLMVHHIGRHHRRRDLKCPYCEKLFVNRQQARKHMAMHTGMKPYKCPECKYSAYQTTNVHTHVSKTHGRKAENASIIIDEEECERMNQMIKVDVDRMFQMRKIAEQQQQGLSH